MHCPKGNTLNGYKWHPGRHIVAMLKLSVDFIPVRHRLTHHNNSLVNSTEGLKYHAIAEKFKVQSSKAGGLC